MGSETIELRKPVAEDGMALFDLVERCQPLDTNSSYCNLLQCSHFADTGVAATLANQLVGFVSGYIKPNEADVWFVWQVAVGAEARGCGLAKRMLQSVLSRPALQQVQYLETTITPDNEASWALFTSLAKTLNAPMEKSVLFEQQQHFKGRHKTEYLVRIGPFPPSAE
ncbi:L-2,4-diaminobutyric acid acetyltransferase [Marinomonas aquimarina]|uniref:L-2,4-diaminobutyric acid acetyltransferase n=1 Tax=Marinomonas aquimarina TaxID=295068 RepID=A0A1A8TMA8_9GAMM|nr:diaminobutyrate acetyltransferase [Marinomonas aquimarina]SBS35128.1 L-2,4-diaminobutyric acid acetyltransferase [Marinomonas aquimarina]